MSSTPAMWLPTIHPFSADLQLDEGGLRTHLRRLASAGASVLVANEGTGESHTFSEAEMRRVLEIAAEELVGTVPVRGMGRMVRTARDMIDFVGWTQAAGLDGVQIYAVEIGHGMRPTSAEQERYLHEVLDRTEIPAFLSLNMVAGWQYSPELIASMLEQYPLIDGLIVTTNSITYLARILGVAEDRADVFASSVNALNNLALGGQGIACPEANIAPRLCVSIVQNFAAGRLAEASTAFRTMIGLSRLIEDYGKSVIKASLDLLGQPGGPPRPPRLPVSDGLLPEVGKILDELDIRRIEGLDG